jgi:pimeloyl-ACP methyl ester carboxylesterase
LARNNTPYEQLLSECIEKNPKWDRSVCEYWAPSKQMHHPNTAFGSIGQRPPMSELLPKIEVPTLILKADAEPGVRKQEQLMADLLPNGRIVHIDGAGHSVRRDQKLVLLETLKDFLDELK